MPRQITFAFDYGVHSDELQFRLGRYVFKLRAQGVTDGDLAHFLSRDVADDGLVVEPVIGDEGASRAGDAIVLCVRRHKRRMD